jgi:type II secretory pathway pseudopilin PulG
MTMQCAKRSRSHREAGFTLVEIAIGLVIAGLIVGSVLGGVQMISNAKLRRQVKDLQGLNAAVYTYYDKFQKLPGDANANGTFDSDSLVWVGLEGENLAHKVHTSPYGSAYAFGFADTSMASLSNRQGNFVAVSLPPDVAANIDVQIDDGVDSTGVVTGSETYTGTGRLTLYYFID